MFLRPRGFNAGALIFEDGSMSDKPEALSLKSNMLWNSIGSLVYLGCSWLTTVLVVTLSSSYADSGALSVAMSVGNLTASVALFKVRPVQVSASSDDYAAADFVGMRVVSSAAAAVFTAVYCMFTVADANILPTLIYAAFKLIESFVDVYHGVFQRFNRLDYAGKSQILRGIVLLVAFVAGMKLAGSLAVAILLMSCGTLAVIAIYDFPRVRICDNVVPVFNSSKLLRLLVACAPGFVSSLLITMVVSMARQSYGATYGNEALGYYAAVATPCIIIQAVASYIYSPLYGSMGKARDEHDISAARRIVVKVLLVIVAFLVACLLCAYLLGEPVLTLIYGSKISDYACLLYGALVCTAAAASVSFLLDVLIIFNKVNAVLLVSISSIAVCVLGLKLLVADANSISFLISASYVVGIALGMGALAKIKSDWSAQ